MTIASVDVTLVELDNVTLKTSYATSHVTRKKHVFVRLTDMDGISGYGEGSPLPHFSGERPVEMVPLIREVFGPALIGREVYETEAAQTALDKALPHHDASKAALMNALLDLQGRKAGLPAHAFLGGKVRERLPLAGAIGIEDDATVVARVSDLMSRGVTTVKLKIGADTKRDIHLMKLLRKEFPAELKIRADANTGFSFVEAQRFLHDVADLRLEYLEQPLRPYDWDGLARLRTMGTPIAVDESLFSIPDAMGLISAGAADVFIVKLIKLGGLHQARKLAALAEAAGVTCVAVSPYETSLGVAANLQIAASSPAFRLATEAGVDVSAVSLPGSSEVRSENGFALLPQSPGLGVTIPDALFASA